MAFPTTSILDDFNRANEGPPPGADWSTPVGGPAGSSGLKVLSNVCGTDNIIDVVGSAMRTATSGPDCEVYATITTLPDDTDFVILGARYNETDAFTWDGYFLYWHRDDTNSLGNGGSWFEVVIASTMVDVIGITNLTVSAGDALGMSVIGSAIKVYHKPSAGAWTPVGSGTDSSITGAGHLYVMTDDTTTRIGDFGGGTGGGGGPNPPVADFTGTPTSGDASLSVDFTDLSTNTPTSWAWDFGDGGTSTNKNPSYVYVTPGTYTVALTATNADGSDTETKTNYITVTTPSAPVADFNGVPVNGSAPLAVYFTDLSTNTPASWSWDFGDSGTSTDQNPIHTYTTPGVYTVALTVTNAGGSDTETKTDYITVLGIPVADFSGTPTSGTVSLSVDFTDLSTNSPTAWYWFFGDGFTDTVQNPTHVYTVVGVYTVALTASNLYGDDSETKFSYITVTDIVEVGPAEVENCDIDTGGLAVGLRVADVAIARDNNLGSLVIDASAELRAKDNAYGTLTNNGTLTSLAGDRAAWDTTAFPARHARDIDEATGLYHLVNATTQTYTVSNPSTDRAYDVSALTLNELAAVVGTLISDLIAKGLLS